MKNIIDYDIITTNYAVTQIKLVKESIKDGWQPYGDLSVLHVKGEPPNHRYAQAMVKYDEKIDINRVISDQMLADWIKKNGIGKEKTIIDESKVIVKNPIMIKENKSKED